MEREKTIREIRQKARVSFVSRRYQIVNRQLSIVNL